MRVVCSNCEGLIPAEHFCGTNGPMGRVCCAACVVHPLGCRCRYGEYGVEETMLWDGATDDEDMM